MVLDRSRRWIVIACCILVTAGFAYYAARNPMDFRVYHFGTRGVFDGTGSIYGLRSGLGWPLHYRYPPLFLPLFSPLAAIPIEWGAAIWVVLKVGALFALTATLWRRLPRMAGRWSWLAPALLAGAYVVEDLRYGNAQSLVFALTAAALLGVASNSRAWWPPAVLALAINIKVWPLFFVPYLVARRQVRAALVALAFTAMFALVPSFFFGFGGNLSLLGEWFHQEFATQTGESEIWFPSQSLRGVMMRYLTVVDYSRVPDSNYPLVHVAALDPGIVRTAWMILAGAAYCALLAVVRRRYPGRVYACDGLAFAALPLLQPFTQKYALVTLLWPALVAGRIPPGKARAALGAAMTLALIQPLIPGASAQRLMQALGLDFLASALIAGAIAAYLFHKEKAATATHAS